jgi:CRP-like cAMP-binding protein
MELKHEFIPKGGAVFRYGEHGDKFYIVLKGEVAVKILDPKYK